MKLQHYSFANHRKQYARLLCFTFILALSAVPAFAAELPETLVPLGITAGIRENSGGVTVAGLLDVETPAGTVSPARDARLQEGDRITALNGTPIASTAELRARVAELGTTPLTLTLLRDGKEETVTLTPVTAADGEVRIGVWIRDAMLGIGTLTWYDPATGRYGALGHGVTGAKGDELQNLDGCVLVPSSVREVVRGKSGDPGELRGSFDESRVIGQVEKNTDAGIFGSYVGEAGTDALPLCPSDEVKAGAAQILSCVEGDTPALYDIRIIRVYGSENGNLRNMLIEVTDKALLSKTGGIVQGMSGSTILQDGKIVGAVTHVLVNDPTRGYGVFIENMIDAAA